MSSGTTTNYFLSYPLSTDPVNVAGDIQELADDLDDFLTSPTFINNIGIDGGVINTTSASATIFPESAASLSIGNVATQIVFGSNSGSATIRNASAIFDGIIEANGGAIETSQSVFNLLSTGASVINFALEAYEISIGSASTTLNISGSADISGDINIDNGQYKISDLPVLSASSLGSGVISSSLEEVATITSGTWQGSIIQPAWGGTGIDNYVIGDMLYASASSTLEKISAVATGNALISGGIGAAPSWGKISLDTHVSGILGPENGGTGVDNSTKTITLGGNLETSGNYSLNLILSDNTTASMPVSGSVATIDNKITDFALSTSSDLQSKISETSGSGSLIFQTSPTLITPIISGNSRISGAAPTIASASAISPNTEILFVSGSATISTIDSPFGAGNGGKIIIIPTEQFSTNTDGNIALATTAIINKALIMAYDPTTEKWYPSY